ncbi:hypothetical protein C9415_10145 [Kluyvera sp. Nf5]|jgi:hypothetical protein|nr:hypothetical protein C9415_10145 [Kluyvera sp. Nf5]
MKIKKFGTIRHEGKDVIIEGFIWVAESIGDYFLSDYQRCKIICDFILDNCEPVESIVDFSAERIVADAIRKAKVSGV